MRLEIARVHLFKKKIKFLLKIRIGAVTKLIFQQSFFIISNNNIENWGLN